MKYTLVLYALASIAAAQKAPATVESCSTALGPSSVKNVKRTTETISTQLTAYKRFCTRVYKTIIPKAKTTTLTSISTTTSLTTLPQDTETISVTVTRFTPVASDASFVPRRRDAPGRLSLAERDTVSKDIPKQRKLVNKKAICYPQLFPQSVKCRKTVKTVTTKTIHAKCSPNPTRTTYLPRRTSTRYTTVTTTITSAVGQDAVTIFVTAIDDVTEISTSTSTQTDTTTSTETQTSIAPSATFYAACDSNNVVGAANGNKGIDRIQYNSGQTRNQVSRNSARTAYDCCVACQTTANCVFTDFSFSDCELIIATSCDPSNSFGTSYLTSGLFGAGQAFFVSNGACGRVPNGGSF
ncbi:hypothetical protein NW762_013655 [Fusarium torreyae]|uniref:Apple domain-containing protein n=1 Tax=Fusarium torreyae TaxID=1237075 RepID=A0A9W8RNA9_9HYPO|nr:hypothetical protein NW762_013655 [Fusarium torreyae]